MPSIQKQISKYYCEINTKIGKISLGATEKGLKFISIGNSTSYSDFIKNAKKTKEPFKEIIDDLKNYFDGKSKIDKTYKLDLDDITDFQKKVYKALKKVPYGQVRSYKWIADQIGNPKASRAVGQANGKNPFPLIIPCHRIISSSGKLGGFSCGIEYKKLLLEIESQLK